ncbi:MAG: MFS transporter [Candidatus Omnitrophica bacterium]|nr:MFS transporter [Candidatus Omnitrophota bacterium]
MKIPTRRNFFLLVFGQGISQFGDKLTQLALVSFVLIYFSNQSAFLISLLISMGIIPVILFSPITGVYIDRWSKRRTMYICDFIRALLVLAIPLFFMKRDFFLVICLILFLSSSVGRFFIPAKMAFIPCLVGNKKIFFANSLISVTATIAAVIGTGIGGFLVDTWGPKNVFYIDSLTFLVSAAAIFFIQTKYKSNGIFCENDPIAEGTDRKKHSFFSELKAGIHYILDCEDTKYAFLIFLFLFSYVGALFPVYIVYVQSVIGTTSSAVKEVGMTSVFIGGGIFCGSLLFSTVADKCDVRKIINWSVLLGSLLLLILVVTIRIYPYLLYALGLSFLLGLSIAPVFIGVNGLIHQKGQRDILGRVFSSLEFIAHLGFLLAMFLFSYLADILSPFTVILTIGIIGFLLASALIINNDSRNRT